MRMRVVETVGDRVGDTSRQSFVLVFDRCSDDEIANDHLVTAIKAFGVESGAVATLVVAGTLEVA